MHEKKLVAKFSHAEIVLYILQIFFELFKLKSSGLEKLFNLRLIKRLFKSNICLILVPQIKKRSIPWNTTKNR